MPQITDKITVVFSGDEKIKLAQKFRDLAGKGHISEVLLELIQSWCSYREQELSDSPQPPISKPPYKIARS